MQLLSSSKIVPFRSLMLVSYDAEDLISECGVKRQMEMAKSYGSVSASKRGK